MQLYILPTPLSREGAYWLYPYWAEVARQVSHFFVEKAVRVRSLLERVGVEQGAAFYEYDPQIGDWRPEDYQRVFRSRAVAALLSESGLPGVADPGASLVRQAHAEGYTVIPLAGPSSITLALAASGLSGQRFTFWGYPPLEKKARRQFLQRVFVQAFDSTQILMETPARQNQLLGEILELAPRHLYLCIAHHLTSAESFVQTRPVSLWERITLPKAPTLFLLGK